MKLSFMNKTYTFEFINLPNTLTCLLLIFSFLFGRQAAAFARTHNLQNRSTVIVLDAGHGGMDPGKVGVNNVLEKDVNLAIVYKLRDMLKNKGYTVVLTRKDDKDLSSDRSANHKMEDLINRVDIMKKNHADLVVSIHQNSFSNASCCGPQVFYYGSSGESETLATELQNALDNSLDISESRGIKCNNDYYLFKNSPAPIVIVECGFLSNPNEADLLNTDLYQSKIARAIYEGIGNYFATLQSPQSTE